MWMGSFKMKICGIEPVRILNGQSLTYSKNKAQGFGIDNLLKEVYDVGEFEEIFALLNDENKTDEPVCGSKPGRAMVNCNCKAGGIMLLRDYFSSDPTYPEHIYHRCFAYQEGHSSTSVLQIRI